MENKVVTFLLAILLALGGWNLSQTFKLSNDMVLVKEKISNIEDKVSKFKPNKKIRKKKKAKLVAGGSGEIRTLGTELTVR